MPHETDSADAYKNTAHLLEDVDDAETFVATFDSTNEIKPVGLYLIHYTDVINGIYYHQ